MSMVVVAAEELRRRVTDILCAADAPEDRARQVANSLVESNLVGHDSHGVMRVPMYVQAIQAGTLKARGEIRAVRESASTARIDCAHTFGQVAMHRGMELALAKAQEHDVAAVVLGNCDHTGRIGEYVVMAAERGFMGLAISNGSLPGGLVAPFGGVKRALGVNPLAWGVPGPTGGNPIFFDWATAAASHGKISVAADKGQRIPAGWLLDKDGRPTQDPNEVFAGGVMLPFGEHKGYGLSVMIELLAGGLSGVGFPLTPGYEWNQGSVLMALKVDAFQPLAEFRQAVAEFADRLKATPRAPDCQEILLPGEPEWRCMAERARSGIPLPEVTWERLEETARSLGLD